MAKPTTYDLNVFINCPLDMNFVPLLEAIIFTVNYLGFIPRSYHDVRLNESLTAGVARLLKSSRFALHDISRGDVSMFDIGLQMGIDSTILEENESNSGPKRRLILDSDPRRLSPFLSKGRGYSIGFHDNDPEQAIPLVYYWLAGSDLDRYPDLNHVLSRFTEFKDNIPSLASALGLDREELGFAHCVQIIKNWTDERRRPEYKGLTFK